MDRGRRGAAGAARSCAASPRSAPCAIGGLRAPRAALLLYLPHWVDDRHVAQDLGDLHLHARGRVGRRHHRLGRAGVAVPGRRSWPSAPRSARAPRTTGGSTCCSPSRWPASPGWSPRSSSGCRRLRVKGLFLAVTTLGFGVAASIVAAQPALLRLDPDRPHRAPRPARPDRPQQPDAHLLLLPGGGDRDAPRPPRASGTAAPAACCWRMRENERGAQAYGVSVVRAKLTAFGISGFVVGRRRRRCSSTTSRPSTTAPSARA